VRHLLHEGVMLLLRAYAISCPGCSCHFIRCDREMRDVTLLPRLGPTPFVSLRTPGVCYRACTLLATTTSCPDYEVDPLIFTGLDERETAEALAVSVSTVKRDWQFARVWLFNELGSPSARAGDTRSNK
jgi:ECF sigma factor